MVLIAVDPHKSSHTACAVDEGGRVLATRRVSADQQARLFAWAQQWPQRRWAVEGARGLGHALAQWLVGQGEQVVDVPARLVRRVRELGGDDKSDRTDARAVAEAALRAGRLASVQREDERAVLRLLADRRDDLAGERTRAVNRLHRLLRELRPGGAPRQLSARKAARLLAEVGAETAADRERLRQAQELLEEVRALDHKLAENKRRMQAAVRAHGSRLLKLRGVGPVVAATLLGRGGTRAFPSRAHFASYSGTAPREASSGDVVRHRLNRGGDRQLNRALHIMARTQVRDSTSAGHAYYQRRRAEGKGELEALRCLKRHLANVVFRCLQEDLAAV
jgi:transposase